METVFESLNQSENTNIKRIENISSHPLISSQDDLLEPLEALSFPKQEQSEAKPINPAPGLERWNRENTDHFWIKTTSFGTRCLICFNFFGFGEIIQCSRCTLKVRIEIHLMK